MEEPVEEPVVLEGEFTTHDLARIVNKLGQVVDDPNADTVKIRIETDKLPPSRRRKIGLFVTNLTKSNQRQRRRSEVSSGHYSTEDMPDLKDYNPETPERFFDNRFLEILDTLEGPVRAVTRKSADYFRGGSHSPGRKALWPSHFLYAFDEFRRHYLFKHLQDSSCPCGLEGACLLDRPTPANQISKSSIQGFTPQSLGKSAAWVFEKSDHQAGEITPRTASVMMEFIRGIEKAV